MRHSVGASRACRGARLQNAKSARRIGARHAQSPSSTFSWSHRRREGTEQRVYWPDWRRQRRPRIGSATAPRRCSTFECEADAASAVEAEVRTRTRRADRLGWLRTARRAVHITPKIDNRGAAACSGHRAARTSALRQPCVQAFETVVHRGRIGTWANRRARRRSAHGLVKGKGSCPARGGSGCAARIAHGGCVSDDRLTVLFGVVAICILEDRDGVRRVGSRVAHHIGRSVAGQLARRAVSAAVRRCLVIRTGLGADRAPLLRRRVLAFDTVVKSPDIRTPRERDDHHAGRSYGAYGQSRAHCKQRTTSAIRLPCPRSKQPRFAASGIPE